jgi:hypothetical protein
MYLVLALELTAGWVFGIFTTLDFVICFTLTLVTVGLLVARQEAEKSEDWIPHWARYKQQGRAGLYFTLYLLSFIPAVANISLAAIAYCMVINLFLGILGVMNWIFRPENV